MMIPPFAPWNIGYSLCTYGSIFIIILLIWQVKRSYHGLRFEPQRSCHRCHRKVRQKARDAGSRAGRCSQKETEKRWDLLSIMKSQQWLPQQESVRQLLCADPSCQTCNAAALEIQQLLEDKTNQISSTLSEPLQGSSCLQVTSMSTVSSKQDLKPHPQHSRDLSLTSAIAALSQVEQNLTQAVAQTTSAISVQEYFADHLHLEQEFQLAKMPVVQESRAPPKLEEPVVPENEEEMVQNKPTLTQGDQSHHHLKCQVSLPSLNLQFLDNLTHPMNLHIDTVLPAHLPFFRPKVLRLLEVHVKKRNHYQRWGLPRRVEDSLRYLMPEPILFSKIGKNLQLSSILNSTSKVTCDKIGIIAQHTWDSYIEPIQSIWVSEWSLIKPEHKHQYQQVQNNETLALPSPTVEVLGDLCLPLEGQANDSGNELHQEDRQLFCGLPSLHSESLAATFLSCEGLSKSKNMFKPPLKESLLFKGLCFHPLLPKTSPEISSLFSTPSPNCVSPAECQQAHISVPSLTPAECETLEWHLLQRQFQPQWGLPAVTQRSRHAHSSVRSEPCDRAQAPEPVNMSWPGKPVSVLTRKLHFFPEHTRRLLEFHFQKQLIHLRWGLPEMIQQSFQLLLSSADQKTLSRSSPTLPNMSAPQPTGKGDGDPFSPLLAQVSIPMPHLFSQAKAKLQSHIDSKCGQIHQGNVPCRVYSSWEGTVPGVLAVAPFPCTPQGQPLALQAASDPDLHDKVMPRMPTALHQQKQASPDTGTEHPKLHQTLSQGAIEKLEMTLRHKYLAFLSGLPALYSVALSGAMAPAITSCSVAAAMVPGPVETPKEPLTQKISLEDPSGRLGPCSQNGKTWADSAEDFQPEVQVKGRTQSVPLESQTRPGVPYSFKTRTSNKLNFHLRKKALEIKLGLSIRAVEARKLTKARPENKFSQASLSSLNNRGSTVLQQPPILPDSSPAPDSQQAHLRDHLAPQPKAVQHNPQSSRPKSASPASTNWPSKISQPVGDMTEAQVLCVQVEASVNHPSLEESWSPEPQNPGKGSAQIPILAEKREDVGKPQVPGDLGEGDAGLGLSLISAERHADDADDADEDQKPEEMLLETEPQGSSQQTHSCHLVDPQQCSSQDHPECQLPEPHTEVPGGKEPEHDMQNHQSKLNVLLKPAKIPENFHPAVARISQGQPTQHKGQILKGQVFQRQVMPAHSPKRPSLSESSLINKMKSSLPCISAMKKDKGRMDPIFPTPGNMAKTKKENVEKSLVLAKSPMEKTKTKTQMRHPKSQSLPTERPPPPLSQALS
nr:protein FAM205A [Cavia porcellus]